MEDWSATGASSPLGPVRLARCDALSLLVHGVLRVLPTLFYTHSFLCYFKVASYVTQVPDPHCLTMCGDSGCRCVASQVPLAQTDHLLVQTENGLTLLCLCGEFQVSTDKLGGPS